MTFDKRRIASIVMMVVAASGARVVTACYDLTPVPAPDAATTPDGAAQDQEDAADVAPPRDGGAQ